VLAPPGSVLSCCVACYQTPLEPALHNINLVLGEMSSLAVPSPAAPARRQASHLLLRTLFLRLLGACYTLAFLGALQQHAGLLFGAEDAFAWRQHSLEGSGWLAKLRAAPTIFWLVPLSETALNTVALTGLALGYLLLVRGGGRAPAPVLLILWALYLSLATVGGEFHAHWCVSAVSRPMRITDGT
jgi:hypothetical protein